MDTIQQHSIPSFSILLLITAMGFVDSMNSSAKELNPVTEHDRFFALKVYPLLREKCFACHGDDPEKIKGELNLTTRENMLKGGEYSKKVLVPGESNKSDLYHSVTWKNTNLEMPPKENDRLTEDQISLFETWINTGAPWPDESIQKSIREEQWPAPANNDGILVKTSGGQADIWTYRRYQPEDIWAFQTVIKPELPKTAKARNHPVDAFIDVKRKASGFKRAPLAEDHTLIRRIYFDLIGLPPKPEEFKRWTALFDESSDKTKTTEALIDALLASPHYGERWAQHWLDVARYADTGGMSNDYERSNAWRYRDYVIRSFNEDKPYDQFVVEQIAGDELADASVRNRLNLNEEEVHKIRLEGKYNEQEAEWIVATGFLRMGPWDNAMVKAPEARQMYLDDVVNAVGQTFLATTMRCVKCHDHKFDPIPTRDYYRLYSAFAGTQMAERSVPFLPEENLKGLTEGRKHVETMVAFATTEKHKLKEKQENSARAWYKEHGKPYVTESDRKDHPDEEKPPRAVGLNHVDQGQLKVREQDEWIWKRRLERYESMAQSVYNGADGKLAWNGARKLRMNKKTHTDWKPDSTILDGGSLTAPGEHVLPGVLSAIGVPVSDAPSDDPFLTTYQLEGRRLGVAEWIADPRNSLTTRAIVNRIWQHHFNKPLAGNPNNFGVKGAKPTHPQLLDWLTADFVENGWKLKRLHRLIMTSRAYRQAGSHPDINKLREKDPNNDLMAYYPPRRLTAEELRDGILRITGELNPTRGGLPVMPEMNMEVALAPRMIQFSLAPAYQPSPTPQSRNRRTIYAYRVRGLADPFLEIFNQPNPNDSCEARNTAAVSPQAFTLLNSDFMTDRSLAFAQRLKKEATSTEAQVKRAFQLTLGRQPDADELTRLTEYVKRMQSYHADIDPEPVNYPSKITRSLVEEFSGKPFEYEEILPSFASYQPDTKPADASPETRALADMCLLLLNSNEFVYLY
ncbi:PSD1 and planctomycete cytochrome C domain-containing protein [Verrucomicrobia bacterium]|nr:PSD1 and planctomycete cytochrome C domain-containing protein [bacterium]MDA7628653.1 PSD1 and planctomycete cytochrome C domain-containing protein [Verrucomicrobiota bacterium]MDA7652988.1 PSD1 and planctomycete cytochrome C domain-containing protein [bacterium]MDA7660331.1 PSD1 and planctomycete cytochrome C domain-containing protein [Verrucomicrobiota bacterium]MDC3182578.1 PSD1 and planctomycete cytochrome C domain-containing protein [bacterium]